MDYILLGICLYQTIKGSFKGFISMLFSLVGTFIIAILSWKLAEILLPYIQNFNIFPFSGQLENVLNGMFPGKFSSIEEFSPLVFQSKYGTIFSLFLEKLLNGINFEGSLTAGQILMPSLSQMIVKILLFIVIFLIISALFRLFKMFMKKLVSISGLTAFDRLLGGLVGLIKGLMLFLVIYFIITSIANIMLNEDLLEFINGGKISASIYDFIIKIILNLFF